MRWYKMEQNVKKKSAHHIYYGVDINTGEVKHISHVLSGTACSCNCIACGQPLLAKKGDTNRHHFAHVSNYDCLYADEVAVYRFVAEALVQMDSICLPAIDLHFPAWRKKECLKGEQRIAISDVAFECGPTQYPPNLTVTAGGSKLRLLLEFGSYYSEDDLTVFAEDARQNNYSVVLYHFPYIQNQAFFTPEHLTEIMSGCGIESKWVRSALADHRRNWYWSIAKQPAKYEDNVPEESGPL